MVHNDNPVTDAILDSVGVTTALLVSVLMLLVSFTGIAPDLVTKIGMGSLSFVVGFFGVRGFLSRTVLGLVLCILFGTVEVFTHTSFALIVTGLQSEAAKDAPKLADDPEYQRLVKRADDLQKTATDMAAKIANVDQGFRSEVNIRQAGVNEQNQAAKQASDAVEAYAKAFNAQLQAWGHQVFRIDANRFFTAIPDALSSGNAARWIAFFFSVLIFSGVQVTVLVTADGMVRFAQRKRQEKEQEAQEQYAKEVLAEEATRPKHGRAPGVIRTIPRKIVYAWVDTLWADMKIGASEKIIPRSVAMEHLKGQGVSITANYDDKLFKLAIEVGAIDPDGRIKRNARDAKSAIDEAQKRKA